MSHSPFRRGLWAAALWMGALHIQRPDAALDRQHLRNGPRCAGRSPARRRGEASRSGRAGARPDRRARQVSVPVHLARHVLRDDLPGRLCDGGLRAGRRRGEPEHATARHDESRRNLRDGHGHRRDARDRRAQDRHGSHVWKDRAAGDPDGAQHLGDPVGRPGRRGQSGQRRREHGGPGGADLEGNDGDVLQSRRRQHHAEWPLAHLLQLRLLSGDPGDHGRLGRQPARRQRDLQPGHQARDQHDPRLGPVFLRAEPLAGRQHATRK